MKDSRSNTVQKNMIKMNKVTCKLIFTAILLFGSMIHVSAQQKAVSAGAEVLSNVGKIASNAQQYVNKIDAVVDKVAENDLYKTVVDGFSGQFPYGIKPSNGNANYALFINEIKPDPELGMIAEIYIKIPIGNNKHLYFLADAVPVSNGSITGDFKLFLLNNVDMTFGQGYKLVFKGLGSGKLDSTYVTFDCKGYKDISLSGRLILDSTAIEQYSEDGEKTNKPLDLSFYVYTDFLENMLLEVSNVPEFQFTSLPGFKCKIESLIIDNSEISNSPSFNLPSHYVEVSPSSASLGPLWKGLYSSEITITVPKAFTEKAVDKEGNSLESYVLTVSDFIIDQDGVSFLAEARAESTVSAPAHLISWQMKGFDYSIDSIGLEIIQNGLTGAKFEGGIVLPISDKNDVAGNTYIDFYIAGKINSKNTGIDYYGGLAIESDEPVIEAKGLSASLELTGLELQFEYKDYQFYPRAILDGSGGIKPKKEGESKELATLDVEFAGLAINSRKPYLSLDEARGGYVKMKGNSSVMAKLPVYFTNMGIVTEDEGQRTGFSATMNVSFQKSSGNNSQSSNGFGGTTDFVVWSRQKVVSKKWKFDGFDLNRITIDLDQKAYKLHGVVERFENNPDYDEGFCGNLDLEVIEKIKVKGTALFGKKDGFRYWLMDANASIPPLQIAPGVDLNSFTGGIYHHMYMTAEKANEGSGCIPSSGRKYLTNNTIFLGLLAGVGVQSTGGGNAFNGNINFGIEFNNNGGINSIATWGGVQFADFGFTPPDISEVADATTSDPEPYDSENPPEPSNERPGDASLWADWFVMYDFPNKTLQGDFNVYVDAMGILKGTGANSRAGNISLYASPEKWYVYCGKPIDPMGIEIINMVKSSSYLCVGKLPTPPMAPMPSEVRGFNSNVMDVGLLNAGNGFAFGSRVSIKGTPGLPLFVCNARAECRYAFGAGFDIMMSQSSQPVPCPGTEYTERGINNWYATGQAFIYGGADIGVSYDCFPFGSGFLNVLGFHVGAGFFAQLPRPSYFQGAVTASFRVLKWPFIQSFNVEVGEICESKTLTNNVLIAE